MKSTLIRLFAYSLILLFAHSLIPSALADGESCTNQYGASVECPPNRLVVNKKVRYPTNTNLFVENVTSKDPAFAPGDEVEYDIAVTNTSNVNYQIVTVIDVLPEEMEFVSGPGRYEAAARKLTYEISDLKAGTTVHNRVLVRVLKSVAVPDCDVVNTVTATGPGGQSDQDTANLCVDIKPTTLPVAGFEDYMMLYPFLALAVIGFGILAVNRRP